MGVVQTQSPIVNPDRDLAIFQAWALGERQHQIAKRLGITQQSVSEAVARARRLQPERDRAEIFDQSLEMIEDLLAVYQPMAVAKDKAAGRLVDRLIGRRNALLGLENPQKLELYQAQAQYEPVDVRQELAALLTKIRGEQHAH